MFRISAEVAVLPVFEAGEEVGRFVERLRLLPDRCKEQEGKNGKERDRHQVDPAGVQNV